ncbi:PREDICTED: protein DPCD-like [Nicrophorus vespilloides]|uniref:Protein DPCD n=1 Tax=Nicrophorus vespilloides TaxID=110193 RepID=A0ABM1MCJ3_NICVS|nr:PREDICTED: protein DPCD-like [Nicrophorus vespilloides]
MDDRWFECVKSAEKSALVQGNTKKVHYHFENGREMVEEYNLDTNVLSRRAWKINNEMGGEGDWDIEVGDPMPAGLKASNDLISEDANSPFITRRVTKRNLEWRIRNLPYPVDIYSVTADEEGRCITVRTSNKKYFKKIDVPELRRCKLLPEQDKITFNHKFNTLIITYAKPTELVEMEKAIYEMVKEVQPQRMASGCPDVNECKPS